MRIRMVLGIVFVLIVILAGCDLVGEGIGSGAGSTEEVDEDDGSVADDGQDDSVAVDSETADEEPADEEPADTTPPDAPVVSGSELTNDNTPEWTWTVPADAVQFRVQLDGVVSEWTVIGLESTGYIPETALADGEHTLYVQAADDAGNWSTSGSYATVVDTVPPVMGELNVSVIDDIRRPTWSWEQVPDAVEVGYRLDEVDGDWTVSSEVSFTPNDPLSAAEHTLYLSAVDAAGNRSDPVSATAPHIEFVTVVEPESVNGSITLDPPAGSLEYGTVMTVTAVADTGYVFDGWDSPYEDCEKSHTIDLVAEEYAFVGTFAAIETKMVPDLSSGMSISTSITYYFYLTLTNTSSETIIIDSVEAYDPDGTLQASSSDQSLLGELPSGESNSVSISNSSNVFGTGSTVKWYCSLNGYEFVITEVSVSGM